MFHLIDSDIEVLNVTREIIVSAGFECRTFDTPATYLEYVNSAAFAPAMAMLTCYIMPDMDGYELVTEVRKKYPLQKAVIISGSPTNGIPHEEESLVCLHLAKPYQAKILIAALKTLNLCDHACDRDHGGSTFKQFCKFGLKHACPFYVGSRE